ncbi:glycosyltransferase family 4 protein [Chlamydiota bacterium]
MDSREKKIKVCHVITRFIIGGAQENTLLTVRGLAENPCYEVTLVTGPSPGPEGDLRYQIKETDRFNFIEIRELQRAIGLYKDICAFFQLVRLFKKERYDIIHTHSSKAGILGRLAAKWVRTSTIVHTIHGLPFHQYQNRIVNAFYIVSEFIAARCCDRLVTVSDAMSTQACKARIAPRDKFVTIRSGMPLESFLEVKKDTALKQQLGIQENELVIGKIARLFYLKGHRFLFDVATQIVQEVPHIKFLLLGDGILYESFKKELTEKGLLERFVFTGLVMPEDISRYISIMDCLVHFSLREGLAKAIVQALAGKVPVVTFDLDGAPEVVQDGVNGFLISVQASELIKEKIVLLCKNHDLRKKMGTNGPKAVYPLYKWQVMVERIDELYQKMV